MTPDEIRAGVLEQLVTVAPEADPASIDATANLREQLDLDSMDFLNFVIALHRRFGVPIPESDYPKLATLSGCIEYVSSTS